METSNAAKRKCSFCGEDIEIDLDRCPYCASLLDVKIDVPSIELSLDERIHISDATPEGMNFSIDSNDSNLNLYGSEIHGNTVKGKNPLGNGLKVFLTIICTIIPGIGQLAGIITGIILMSSEDEQFSDDKKSFGFSLLVACLIMFVLTGISWFIVLLTIAIPFNQ